MKERLIQLLDLEQLSPSKFADLIGVQRSSISHVISGRNKPSFDFLQKTLKAFPGLNASWLLMGEGSMYEQMGRKGSGNLFDTREPEQAPSEKEIPESERKVFAISQADEPVSASTGQQDASVGGEEPEEQVQQTPVEPVQKDLGTGKKRIVQVMVIYEDDTFKTFMPAH